MLTPRLSILLLIVGRVLAAGGEPAIADPSESGEAFLETLREAQAYRDHVSFRSEHEVSTAMEPGLVMPQTNTGWSAITLDGDRFRHVREAVTSNADWSKSIRYNYLDVRYDAARFERYARYGEFEQRGEMLEATRSAPLGQPGDDLTEEWSVRWEKADVTAIIGSSGTPFPLFGVLRTNESTWLDSFLEMHTPFSEPWDEPCAAGGPDAVGRRFYGDAVDVRVWLDPNRGHQVVGLEVRVEPEFGYPEVTIRITDIEIEQVDGRWIPVRGTYVFDRPSPFRGTKFGGPQTEREEPSIVRTTVHVRMTDFAFDRENSDEFFHHQFPDGAEVLESGNRNWTALEDGRTLTPAREPVLSVLLRIQREARGMRHLARK